MIRGDELAFANRHGLDHDRRFEFGRQGWMSQVDCGKHQGETNEQGARSEVLTLRPGSGQAPSKITKGEAASFVVARGMGRPDVRHPDANSRFLLPRFARASA